jgi:serine/threonine-protein kinase
MQRADRTGSGQLREATATLSPTTGEPQRSLPALGDLLANRFELVREIGHGGSGVVFAARDLLVGRDVAVKLLRPEMLDRAGTERLRREVRGAGVGHPNLVGVYDLIEDSERELTFLVLELVEGMSLRERMREASTLAVTEVVRIGQQIAQALVHLHTQGLVHRDVKPANILLASDGTAKLCDLGLVRPVETGDTVTETAMVIGTPAYMAPEQGTGRSVGPSTDVYALGLTVFAASSGDVPLREDSAVATLLRRGSETAPRLRSRQPHTPRWLDALLAAMLDPSPSRRPSSRAVAQAFAVGRFRGSVPWRAAALAATIVATAVTMALVGGQILSVSRRAESVVVEERTVLGIAKNGDEVWSHRLPRTPDEHRKKDLDGDGTLEHIFPISATDESTSQLSVLSREGRLMTAIEPERLVRENSRYPERFALQLWPMDVNHDGITELLLGCRQLRFYPYHLLVYWPSSNEWNAVYRHNGWIYDIEGLSGPTQNRLRFVALNNLFGIVPVVGELELVQRERGHLLSSAMAARLTNYTLLPFRSSDQDAGRRKELELTSGGESRAIIGKTELALDQWGNPQGGSNSGTDLRLERVRFAETLRVLLLAPANAPEANVALSDLRDRTALLFQEATYRSVFEVTRARLLAREGNTDDAITLLMESCARHPTPDTFFRRAHLQALSGDLEAAEASLRALRSLDVSGRSHYDGPQLMLRIGIESRSEPLVRKAITLLDTKGSPKFDSRASALWARAHLWWDECSPTATVASSSPFAPAGSAMACLCRWRRGESSSGDIEAMRELIERRPDAEHEARVALAAAQLATGDHTGALVTLDRVVIDLEPISHDDFDKHQVLELAEALRVVVMAEMDELEQARADARKTLDHLTTGLLPAKLCEEVCAGSTADEAS